MSKVGATEGTCPNCGKTLWRPHPVDVAVCDCWEYCPTDHGDGPYGTRMNPYTPDLTPQTYKEIDSDAEDTWGDLKHPIDIVRVCPICGYHSKQLPVEVTLK